MMILKLAVKNLSRQKNRTFAILITVALGICSLMIYHGFNTGIMNQYRENTIHAKFAHGQINTKGYRDMIWDKPWERWLESDHPVLKELKQSSAISELYPRVSFYGLINNGQRSISGFGEGVLGPIEAEFFTTINVVSGKNLSTEEDGILIGKGLAESLNVKVGDRVTILANTVNGSLNGLDFFVTGIFHSGMKSFDDMYFKIQLDKAQIILDSNKIEYVAIATKELKDWPKVKEVVKNHPDIESIAFNDLDKVYYQNSVDFLQAQFNVILVVIFCIVVLGIFNTVSTIIIERKYEIGNLRANGDSKMEILRLLLVESCVLGLLGTVIGVVASYLINASLLSKGINMPPGPGITRQFTTFVELQVDFIPVCLFIGLTSTLIGSFLAGLKVVRTPIGQLLRSAQ